MNYLELTNRAILEAGKDMDPLTSANFASPPSGRMFERFKNWVNEAYIQLQMARENWQFKTARATVNLYPAIYVEAGDRATAPPVNSDYAGQDTEFTFNVNQVITHSGAWASGTAKATIYFDDFEGTDFKFNEAFDETAPTPATDIFVCKGWGRYNFRTDGQVTDLMEPHKESFMIEDADPESLGLIPLIYVEWDKWQETVNSMTGGRAKPEYVTTAPDGSLEFYPRPDRQYYVHFEYVVDDLSMSAYNDSPTTIPSRYHMAIVWAAVIKAGMYDRDSAVVSKATKEYNFYRNRMETNLMPDVGFATSRYNRE